MKIQITVKVKTMYEAYFDAAINHPKKNSTEKKACTVYSYLASNDDWRKFSKEWHRELSKKGIEYFHMTDFEFAHSQLIGGRKVPDRNPFRDLPQKSFIPLLQELHKTIGRKTPAGFNRLAGHGCHVLYDAFMSLRPEELKNDPICSSPFVFCVTFTLRQIQAWAHNKGLREPIRYIFASGDGENGNLNRLFQHLAADQYRVQSYHLYLESGAQGYELRSMKETPAIQAVDIACFESAKNYQNWTRKARPIHIPTSGIRKSLKHLSQQIEHPGLIYEEKQLTEEFAERIRVLNESQ